MHCIRFDGSNTAGAARNPVTFRCRRRYNNAPWCAEACPLGYTFYVTYSASGTLGYCSITGQVGLSDLATAVPCTTNATVCNPGDYYQIGKAPCPDGNPVPAGQRACSNGSAPSCTDVSALAAARPRP